MMMSALLPPDATLAQVLSYRARNTPQSRLVIDIVGGGVVAAAAAWATFPGWVALASAATAWAAYGAWGWIDQSLAGATAPMGDAAMRRWRALQLGAAAVGLGAFGLFLLAALGIALGKIIS